MSEIIRFIVVLILSSFLDAFLTLAIIYTDKKRSIPASLWTGAGYLISDITILSFVSDKKLIVASVLGAMIGCYFVVKYM